VSKDYQIHIYKTWKEVPQSWKEVLPPTHNLQIADLAAVEYAKIKGLEPLYVMASRGNEVRALVYVQLLRFTPDFLSTAEVGPLRRGLASVLLGCLPMKLLVLGHLFRHDGQYVHFAESENASLQLYQHIVESVMALNRHNAVMFKDLPQMLKGINSVVPHLTSFDNDVSMHMHIPAEWHSFEDYKLALKHKYTQRCSKTQKAFSEVIIADMTLQDVQQHSERIHELYMMVAKKQTVSLGLLNEAYFSEFKKAMGDRLHMQGMYYKDELIAFTSATVAHGVYDMNYIGFDYAHNQKLQLYFNILFNCVDNAIKYRAHNLVLGRTALEAKAIVGCKAQEQYGYYRINNSVLRAVANRLSSDSVEQQGEQWKDRHPFKSEYYG
jgi:hypothetical protein